MNEMVLDILITSTACTVDGSSSILGKLYAVEYQFGNLPATADLTLTCVEPGAVAKPLLTVVDAPAANAWYYPRDLVHGVADGVALAGTSGGDRALPILAGVPHLVVADGGADNKYGKIILYWED